LRDHLSVFTLVLVKVVALALVLLSSACSAPGAVEGVFGGEDFTLQCATPLSKTFASGRDSVVVLSEYDSETLRTVNLQIPRFGELPVGEAVEVGGGDTGDARPWVDVVVGELVVDTRSDGVEIISSENAKRAWSVGGTLILEDRTNDALAGTFAVELDDGGFLDGTFVAQPSL